MSLSAPVRLENHAIKPARTTTVLFIVDQLCQLGGAERVLLNIIRHLPRNRFAPHLVTFKINPTLDIFDNFPCPLHLLPLQRTWDLNAARVAWRLRRLIQRERIDIVHTFFETSDLWGGVIARMSGTRVLISSRRDMGILRSRKHQIGYRLVNGLYDQIQTVSEQVRSYCVEHDGVSPSRVLTIYNGVDVERAQESPHAAYERLPQLRASSHVITTVAHIRKVKGIDVLLSTAAEVCARFPEAIFLVIGDSPERGYYRDLMRQRQDLGLENRVLFPGALGDVFPFLKASTVFFLPSRSEGLSNALLEAMACGLPCVATDVGGNPEVICDGSSGFLIPSESPACAAERILWLLEDASLAHRLGQQGRTTVETRFTTDAMMRQLMRSYELLLESVEQL